MNVIIKEHIFTKCLQKDTYDTCDIWTQTLNGFLYHPQGSISLPVTLNGKVVDTTFVVIPTSNQFQIKLSIS